jgi:hypothetical protein
VTKGDNLLVSRALVELAIRVALEAPIKQSKYSYRAGVKWSTIHELRDELTKHGVDWRKHHPSSRA